MPRQYTPRVNLTCHLCGLAFSRSPSAVIGGRNYCSRACKVRGDRGTRRPSVPELSADGLTARISLHHTDGSVRAYAIIDATDAQWLSRWRWHLAARYARRLEVIDGIQRTILMHRALMGLVPGDGLEVDHIDRNRLNNRRSNLRIVPRGAQPQNMPARTTGTSRHRGVSRRSDCRRWEARVYANGKQIRLGRFESEDEAAEAARRARLLLMPYATD